jgi:hypothetical protein
MHIPEHIRSTATQDGALLMDIQAGNMFNLNCPLSTCSQIWWKVVQSLKFCPYWNRKRE